MADLEELARVSLLWEQLDQRADRNTGDEAEDSFHMGKRDGFSEAVQLIDQMTGGDGEFRFCLGMEQDERHCPTPDAMILRIVARTEGSPNG